MHGLIVKITAVEGKRDELIAILLQGTRDMPGCLSYIVARDPADATTIWVTEVWDDQASHTASMSLAAVQEAIAGGKPLIARFEQRVVTEPVGGHGLTTAGANKIARHGGLSYLEISALDAQQSAAFYGQVLGWRTERREANDHRFEDATGYLIGRWVSPRAISQEPGWLPYFYVNHIDDAVGRVVEHGGEIVKTPYPEGNLWVATVRDPAGNVLGLWQAGPRSSGRRASTREGVEPVAADCRSSQAGGGTSMKSPAAVSVAPWLSLRNGARAVEFYKAAFGAKEVYRVEDPAGSVVSRLSIEGAEFWLSDESPEHANFSPESLGGGTVKMILTVADPDSIFATAVAAGAREVSPVQEGHGWRVGRIVDPFGHHWEIGHPVVT